MKLRSVDSNGDSFLKSKTCSMLLYCLKDLKFDLSENLFIIHIFGHCYHCLQNMTPHNFRDPIN